MKSNILAENMRRFGTKNLSEQVPAGLEYYVTIGSARIPRYGGLETTSNGIRFNLRDIEMRKDDIYPNRLMSLINPGVEFDRIRQLQIEIRRPIEIDNGSDQKIYRVNDRNTISLIGFDPADWNDPSGNELKELLYNMFKDFVAPPPVPNMQNLKP